MAGKLNEKNVSEIREMFKSNYSMKKVAEHYGCVIETVRRFCINNDIEYLKRPRQEQPNNEKYMYKGNKSKFIPLEKKKLYDVYTDETKVLKEKLKILGVSSATLYKNLSFHNISRNNKKEDDFYVNRFNKEELVELLTDKSIKSSIKCSKLDVTFEQLVNLYKENDLNYFAYNVPEFKIEEKEEEAAVTIDDSIVEEVKPLKLSEFRNKFNDEEQDENELHNEEELQDEINKDIEEIEEVEEVEEVEEQSINEVIDIPEIKNEVIEQTNIQPDKFNNLQTLNININISLTFNFDKNQTFESISQNVNKLVNENVSNAINSIVK